ncbi:MAG: molybdate ABC transporter substrate-binding protein [Gemmobacter sp.]|nr:molybdate ABC transporter substrate-binding protein [Gemmobacter sp.]
MPPLSRNLLLLGGILALGLPFQATAEEVMVFAAASLQNALDEIATDFHAGTGNTVTISYAGSSQLARQIVAGAPADIFISAATSWMDEVEKAGLVANGRRTDLLSNTLVLVSHGDASPVEIGPDFDLEALLGGGKLAMALVDSVPAGQYGKAALEHLGQWHSVAPSVAETDNVRAALALVSSGEAPYGIVYATDAAAAPHVTVVGTFSADSHQPIIYPAALLTGAADPADTAFYEALSGVRAAGIFAAHGFTIPR